MGEKNIDPIGILGAPDAALIRSLVQKGATRRDVMSWLMAAGMGVASAGSVASYATRALAETAKKGGRLRVAGAGTSLDGKLAPQLALAESIENDKATVWTIKLRKDVTFHDGKKLTADDVVYSLNRHKDPAVGSKAKSLADQITAVKATGPNEVQITLSAPNADLPVVLGTFHFLIVKDGTTDFSTAVGTGPYRCQEFKPGVRSIAVRNDGYWKPGQPYLDEIEFIGIPDESARVNALLSGDVQMIAAVNARSAGRISSTPGYQIHETKSGNYTDLVMRVDTAPTQNADFVLAMKYLFDREQMRSAIVRGFAVLGNDNPIDPTNRFYNSELPQRPYDLDKAKFHFQKAGIGNTAVPITVSPAADNSVEMALLLQQAGQKIGLNLDIQRVPADGYWTNHWMKHPLGFGNINPRPSADILFTLFFKSDAAWNECGWKNAKFDQLLAAARAETDEAKRKQMYWDMQTIVHEGSGIGIPMFLSLIDGLSSKVKGLGSIPLGGLMGYNFAENVWLEA